MQPLRVDVVGVQRSMYNEYLWKILIKAREHTGAESMDGVGAEGK